MLESIPPSGGGSGGSGDVPEPPSKPGGKEQKPAEGGSSAPGASPYDDSGPGSHQVLGMEMTDKQYKMYQKLQIQWSETYLKPIWKKQLEALKKLGKENPDQ